MFYISSITFVLVKRANDLLLGGFVHTFIETQWYLRITKKNKKPQKNGKLKFKKIVERKNFH